MPIDRQPPGGIYERQRRMTHADAYKAAEYRHRAELVLSEQPEPAAVADAYRELRAWHNRFHSRNRPPELNCTGCHVWPVIAQLAARLGFDPLDPPRDYWD